MVTNQHKHMLLLGVALLVFVSGCGMTKPSKSATLFSTGNKNATSLSLAAAAIKIIGEDPMRVRSDVENPSAPISASLDYEGGTIDIRVSSNDSKFAFADCRRSVLDGCDTFSYEGVELDLRWQESAPEEDPGMVTILRNNPGEVVQVVLYPNDSITGDPRSKKHALAIDFEVLARIASDRSIGLRTTGSLLKAGA